MKKLLTQILILAVALTVSVTTLAQSPAGTRQRRPPPDVADPQAPASPAKSDDQAKAAPATDEPLANRVNQDTDEAAIVQNYNNFFATYKLGPEDIISVMVFGQDRYSKSGIKVPPSGR